MGTFTNLGLGNLSGVQESTFEVPVYEGYVDPSLDGIMAITQETAHDFYQLNSALYVADVVHEEATLESAGRAEEILESVVSDSVEKMKKYFMNLWSKLKAWFASAIAYLKNMFVSGKKFVEANKKRLNEKNVLGFKYKGRKLTPSETGVQVADKVVAIIKDEQADLTSAPSMTDGKFDKTPQEEKEALLKQVGYEEISELTKEIRLSYFGGQDSDDADEIVDFGANDKSELMELVSNSGKAVSNVEKLRTATDKAIAGIIKELNAAAGKANKDESAADRDKAINIAVINRKVNNIKYLLTVHNAAIGATVEGIKAQSKDAERVLRKYLTYKPAKESFDTTGGSGEVVTESLLDRAIKLI